MEVNDLGAAWAHGYPDGLDAGEPASTRISITWLLARAVGFCRRAIVLVMTAVAGLVGILPHHSLSAEPIASQLHPVAKLAWLANTETNLSGYRLYYGFAPDRLNYSTNVGLGTNATIELPVGNETYFFAATAINTDSLESEFSNTVSNWFSVGPDVVVTQVVMDRLHGTEGQTLLLPFPSNLVNAVEWTLVEPPEGGTLNVRSNDLEFVPTTGFAGTNHFRYAVNLGNRELVHLEGGMEFQPVNDPPLALDDEVVTPINTPIQILLFAVDSDNDDLKFRIVRPPEFGRLEENLPTVTYWPDPDYIGGDSFEFVVNDGQADSEPGVIHIDVEPETDPTAELRLLVLTDEDTPVDFQLETPPLGLGPFRFEVFEDIPGLSYHPSQAAARYVPATNKNGVVHFAYRVTDANHLTALGGVEILVLPVNDPPVALPREIVVRSGSMTKLPIEGRDVDFDDLTVRIREEPVHGKLTPTAEGYFYLPNDDFIGEDELTYFVSDGESESEVVACRILVVPTAEISVPPSLETDISGKPTLRLKWKTFPGVRYVVVSNPDLDPRNWQRITEPQVASGTEQSLVIPIPQGSESRWYAVEMPDFKL